MSHINSILEEFKITSKINAVVRDGGSNLVSGFRNSVMESVYCLTHQLQLIVKGHVLDQRMVKDAIARCKNFVSHINKSTVAAEKFRKIQENVGFRKVLKLIQDVCTRWDSTFYMLKRFVKLKTAIVIFSSENPDPSRDLSSTDWDILKKVLDLLRPFQEATKEASYRKSSNIYGHPNYS